MVFDSTLYERKAARNAMVLNEIWIELLMGLVGEQCPHGELVNGAVFKRRQAEDRLEIWTRDLAECTMEKVEMQSYFTALLANFGNVEYVTHDHHKEFLATFQKGGNGTGQQSEGGRGTSGRWQSGRRDSRR